MSSRRTHSRCPGVMKREMARSSATSRAPARWSPTASSPPPSPGCPTRTSIPRSELCRGSRTSRSCLRSTARDVTWSISRRASSTPNGRKGGTGVVGRTDRIDRPRLLRRSRADLTAEAAEAAGLGKVTLLEEPLAAFYAWTAQAGKEWRAQVSPGDIVLVCDVGGGTADFSLIAVTENEGALALERISVGEHILLGGDNMDLALAYALRPTGIGRQEDRRLAVPGARARRR